MAAARTRQDNVVSALSWEKVEAIYHAARALPADQRAAFVRGACGPDGVLLAEVSSLLSYDTVGSDYLDRSALENAASALAEETADWQPGATIAGYCIAEYLGSGGMGDVYRARDLTLERDVALKLFTIAPAGDASVLRRFEEEARAASALAHPGIVTIYSVGEAGSIGFIAMELVRGETLRARFSAGPMSLDDTIDLGVQLADAVHAAHCGGVVHRDLKPENIMVTDDGRVKVLDFGIAMRHGSSDGIAAGTAAYMAPEQRLGITTDARSDQYSVGAVLYEMLTAQRLVDPALVAKNRVDTRHRQLVLVIRRAVAEDPNRRYESMLAFAVALRELRDKYRGASAGTSRRQALRVGAGAVGALAMAGLGWKWFTSGSGATSLAILPFANVERDAGLDYLCDGLTGSLIEVLASPGLRVMAQSTVSHFRTAKDPKRAGQALNVATVLSGAISRGAGGLHVTAELIDARTGARLWGRTYDRPVADIAIIQADIARAIVADGLQIRLGRSDKSRLQRRLSVKPEAYERYLMGVRLAREGSEEGCVKAQAALAEAVRLDPEFAEAHAALSATFSVRAVDGYLAPREAWAEATRSFRRALALDELLPNAHAEFATWLLFSQWDWRAAEREWEAALRGPSADSQPDYLIAYALECWATGRSDLAISLARRARKLDPFSLAFAIREADLLFSAGQDEAARAIYSDVAGIDSADPRGHLGLAEILRRQGRYDDALVAMRTAFEHDGRGDLAAAYGGARGRDGLERLRHAAAVADLSALRVRAASGAYVSALDVARVHACLGNTSQAIACFPQALAERSPGLVFLTVDPVWDALRQEPMFRTAVARVGLRPA
jgi:eukaryotic-like serine/threonine-protein kinase